MNLIDTPKPEISPPQFYQRLWGVLRLTHFFPNVVVLSTTLILGIIASKGQIEWGNLARVWLAVLGGHCAIGITNEYVDFRQDVIAQPYKPLPSGLVSRPFALGLIIGLLLLNIGLALTLPIAAGLLNIVCVGAGMLYNFRLKNTWLSWIPYLLSFSSLPIFVWAGLGRFEPKLLWLYPLAILLVVGLNLANSLPDIETDLQYNQAQGLGHILGTRRTLLAVWGLFTAAPLICLSLSFIIPVNQGLAWCGGGLALLLVILSYFAPRFRPGRPGLVLVWQLTSFATALLAIGWLGALTL